jgi:endoglucanase
MQLKKIFRFIIIALSSCAFLIFFLSSIQSFSTQSRASDFSVDKYYTVKSDVLAIEFVAGDFVRGKQVPYEAEPQDSLLEEKGITWVKRSGQPIGALVGRDKNVLYRFTEFFGSGSTPGWLDRSAAYEITSEDDESYKNGIHPEAVFRKTKPIDMLEVEQGKFSFQKRHTIYLKLRSPLNPSSSYQIKFSGKQVDGLDFQYQPKLIQSEAVHISHIGFRPDDPAKIGFLSTWTGNGGGVGYPEGLKFWLQTFSDQTEVYNGLTKLSKVSFKQEDPYRNYSGTDIYLMDFSDFDEAGEYQLCVEAVGCSVPFNISEAAWKEPFYVSARGFYHQRSGVELKPPYTDYYRPRPFHPDDGLEVYQSTVPLMDTNMGLNLNKLDVYKDLPQSITSEVVPNAWGGYMDAGDWDRRIQHLIAARMMLELAEQFPDYVTALSLDIPESSNDLPDIVDEALWGIDFFKRLQTSEGSIRGGIESTGSPQFGEASWQESHQVFAYAPGLWSTYMYAGVAAKAASWLQRRSPDLSAEYRDSALKAMRYAETEFAQQLSKEPPLPHDVEDLRNLAALELWHLTQEQQWHRIFLDTTAFVEPQGDVFKNNSFDQADAAFLYASLPLGRVDPDVQLNAKRALLSAANKLIDVQEQTAFKWSKTNSYTPVFWAGALGTPQAIAFLRAHALSGDDRYLRAAVLACQFSAGANPDNMVYTTGVGHRAPHNPLIVDQRVTGQDPPPGITVYGPSDLDRFKDFWFLKRYGEETEPPMSEWPPVESYFDVYYFVPTTEFTIHQTMAPTMYTWGYLAARQ